MTLDATPPVDAPTTPVDPAAQTPSAPTPPATPNPPAPDTPVEYKFETPEGIEALDTKGVEDLTALAKELKIAPADAQKFVNLYAARKQAEAAQLQETVTGWEDQVKKDPAIGGDKLNATIETAKKAISTYGSPELLALLDTSRMGSHPEVVKFLHKVGLTLKEDSIVTGKPPVAPANTFYDKSNMAP